MIRKNVLRGKLYRFKSSSSVALFDDFMDHFCPGREICPACGSSGNCHPHAYYDRHIVDYHDGKVCEESLHILRVRCCSCGCTHAILPDFIVPYGSYGFLFILQTLREYFTRTQSSLSVEALCERFGIAPRVLYRWLRLWKKHKRLWLGILKDSEVPSLAFLDQLFAGHSYPQFLPDFFRQTSFSFLQRHKNPALIRPKGAH